MDIHAENGTVLPPIWEVEMGVVQIACECTQIPFESLHLDSRILEDLGMESLDLVEFIMALEEAFDVTLPDEDAPHFFTDDPTLGDVARWVLLRWGTGKADRSRWHSPRDPLCPAETMPFTQYGGKLSPDGWMAGPLYHPLGKNREGYEQFRRATDGMRCVAIPAGEVRMSRPEDGPPTARVRLAAFLIDAEPVSNQAYCRFLNSVGKVAPAVVAEWCGAEDRRSVHFPLQHSWRGWTPLKGTEEQPVILVSWYGANAYAVWANRMDWRYYRADGGIPEALRSMKVTAPTPTALTLYSALPSEAQWEYAARGGEANPSPGATSIEDRRGGTAVVERHWSGATYTADGLPSAPVNERRGMSPFGLHHMAGNVWQWCRDGYEAAYPPGPRTGFGDLSNANSTGIRSERGGSWVGPKELADPGYRRGRPPAMRGRCLGFRCVGLDELKDVT